MARKHAFFDHPVAKKLLAADQKRLFPKYKITVAIDHNEWQIWALISKTAAGVLTLEGKFLV